MGRERSLLEKISDPPSETRRTMHENTQHLADSVLRHLQRMLNTRQGHALIQPEYGMPDVMDFVQNLPEMVNRVQRGIQNSIQKFEPRLRNASVVYVPASGPGLSLRFEITAELVTEQEEASVWFETSVEPSGRIAIKG